MFLQRDRKLASLTVLLTEVVRKRKLDEPDHAVAAEHLVGPWQGMSDHQPFLGIDQRRIRSTLEERVDAGLGVFLAAYRPSERAGRLRG